MRVCVRENFGLPLGTRIKLRRMRLFWRDSFGLKWFTLWAAAFLIYLIIGLQPVEAKNYHIVGQLTIPSIGLTSDVAELTLEDGNLATPDSLVGGFYSAAHKTLLIGHSTGIFSELHALKTGDALKYDDQAYTVVSTEILPKTAVDMRKILQAEANDTLILMTCAGTLLSNGDATERLIVTATANTTLNETELSS